MEHYPVKTIADHMSFYEAYHKHPLNKATHFIGIPMIIYSILVPMSAAGVAIGGTTITLAMVFVASVLTYYVVLDRAFGIAMCLLSFLGCVSFVKKLTNSPAEQQTQA